MAIEPVGEVELPALLREGVGAMRRARTRRSVAS
jgi:hypothetical protein